MLNKVIKTILKFNMLNNNDKVLVALSGGADSVCLLLILKELGYEIIACHVNHNLRGEESSRDEKFCRELCERINVKLIVENIDVNTFCIENSLGTEEAARILRYEILQKNANNMQIATAHTINDSFETSIFNLSRGASIKGLSGIPPVRDNIIRPLIFCKRLEIENYLLSKKEAFVNDSTNFSTEFTRNKIRHKIIPIIEEINPNFYKNYEKTIVLLNEEDEFLNHLAKKLLLKAENEKNIYNLECFLEENDVVLKRAIALMLKNSLGEYNNKKINDILLIIHNKKGKINLAKDVYLLVNQGKIHIYIEKSSDANLNDNFSELVTYDKKILFFDKIISIEKNHYSPKSLGIDDDIHNFLTYFILDCDKIKGELVLRNRRDGDKIHFYKKAHTTSVKKLFNEKIPLENRKRIAFLADELGVIFIEGFGVAQRVAVDENTKNILKINMT